MPDLSHHLGCVERGLHGAHGMVATTMRAACKLELEPTRAYFDGLKSKLAIIEKSLIAAETASLTMQKEHTAEAGKEAA